MSWRHGLKRKAFPRNGDSPTDMAPRNPSVIDKLDSGCLMLILKAIKSNSSDATTPTPYQIHERNAELVKLRWVRRGWKNLIDSQPYLWSSIAFIMGDRASIESAIMFLHYSQPAIIHLYGHGGVLRLDKPTRRLARGLKQQLQAASHHIVSFHIVEPTPAMLCLWPTSAPNLEAMVINTKTSFPAQFCGEMPLLRSIVAPILNENQYLMTQNITSLVLYPPYALEELLATLKNTPMLQNLELRRISEFGRDNLPPVSLPHLEALLLSNCFYQIIHFIDFPAHTRIVISIPDQIKSDVTMSDIDTLTSFFIPPAFLRASTLRITTRDVRGPTKFQIVGQDTGNGYLCHVFIDLEKGLRARYRYDFCVYALRMARVRSMTSVSSVQFMSGPLYALQSSRPERSSALSV